MFPDNTLDILVTYRSSKTTNAPLLIIYSIKQTMMWDVFPFLNLYSLIFYSYSPHTTTELLFYFYPSDFINGLPDQC